MLKKWGVVIVFCLADNFLTAQSVIEDFEIGVHGGLAIYQGDLTPSTFGSYKTIRSVAGFYANIIISPAFSVRPNVNFGTLEGDDSKYNDREWRQQRNFKFRSSFKEVSTLVLWDIFSKNHDYIREGFSPYLSAGIGYSFLNRRSDYSRFNRQYFLTSGMGEIAGLDQDIRQQQPAGMVVFPIGVGVRHSISPNFGYQAEISYRLSSTDYLDGFSKAGNPKEMDRYYSVTIGLIFSPKKKGSDGSIKCPVVGK